MKNKTTKKYDLTEETIAVGLIHTNAPFHLASDEKDVRHLAETWVDNKCENIFVSFRDGMYWVIEGQKRTLSAKMRFGNEKKLKCFVRRDCKTLADDAQWFYELNHQKRKFSESTEGYLSRQYFDEDWKNILDALNKASLTCSYSGSRNDGSVACLTTLEKIYEDYNNKENFTNMLILLNNSICGAKESLMANFLKGFSVFYKTYNNSIDVKILEKCFVKKDKSAKKQYIDLNMFDVIAKDTEKYKSEYSKIGKAGAQAIRGLYNKTTRKKDKELKLSLLEDVVTTL